MQVSTFSDLPSVVERAVIINVRTTQVSTLALLSTLRYGQMPVLVVDCEPAGGSLGWFRNLMEHYRFDLIEAPIRRHGEMLDVLFREVPCEQILLVDSDVEVLNDMLLRQMRAGMQSDRRVFGSGYLHPAQWLEHHWDTSDPIPAGIGYYLARPWIPFTLLRVAQMRLALSSGCSFMHKLVYNDIPQSALLSRLLFLRFRYAASRRLKLRWLDPLRKTFDGHKPGYVHYDTGAAIHEHLNRLGFRFAAVSNAAEVPWSVLHLGGATRSGLYGERHDSVPVDDAAAYARQRLRSQYGLVVPDIGN